MPAIDGPAPYAVNIDGSHALWYGADVHATISSLAKHRIVVERRLRGRARALTSYQLQRQPLLHRCSTTITAAIAPASVAEDGIRCLDHAMNAGLRYDQARRPRAATTRAYRTSSCAGLHAIQVQAGSYTVRPYRACRTRMKCRWLMEASLDRASWEKPVMKAEHIGDHRTGLSKENGCYDGARKLCCSGKRARSDQPDASMRSSINLHFSATVSRAQRYRARRLNFLLAEQRVAVCSPPRDRSARQIGSRLEHFGASAANSKCRLLSAKLNLSLPFFSQRIDDRTSRCNARRPRLRRSRRAAGGFCLANLTLSLAPSRFAGRSGQFSIL